MQSGALLSQSRCASTGVLRAHRQSVATGCSSNCAGAQVSVPSSPCKAERCYHSRVVRLLECCEPTDSRWRQAAAVTAQELKCLCPARHAKRSAAITVALCVYWSVASPQTVGGDRLQQ